MPHQKSVNSLRDLRQLKLKHDAVQITRAGGLYRARFRGSANSVFGASPEEAAKRLRSVSADAYRDNPQNTNERRIKESVYQ